MKDNTFKNDAKQIVDMCFDNKLFKDNIKRDDMNGFEDLITFLLKSRYESYIKVTELMNKIDELPKKQTK